MVDWGGSSLQIVVAIIGSGLIVTGLTSLNSIVNNPLVHIDVEVKARFHGIKGNEFQPYDENYDWVKCNCERWFKTEEVLQAHLAAYPHPDYKDSDPAGPLRRNL